MIADSDIITMITRALWFNVASASMCLVLSAVVTHVWASIALITLSLASTGCVVLMWWRRNQVRARMRAARERAAR